MRKWKKWLVEQVLPVYARAELMAENERLRQRLARLEAYVEGLRWGVCAQRKTIIDRRELEK